MTSRKVTSYNYDVFKKYQLKNNLLPQHLVQWCVPETNNLMPSIDYFDDSLNEIVASITKGNNPNNIVFRNLVKSYVNTVNQNNYNECLHKLKALDFSSRENIHFLCNELIVCAIRFPSAVKGFTFQEDPSSRSVPEICVDIAKAFCPMVVKNGETEISFRKELTDMCHQYFLDFMDLGKSMDEHNENTSDNYRGFMTFMGLLYSKGILNVAAVCDCIDMIKRTTFCHVCVNSGCREVGGVGNKGKKNSHACDGHSKKLTAKGTKLEQVLCYYDCGTCSVKEGDEIGMMVSIRKQYECVNFHKGYEHLMNHVIHSLQGRVPELCGNLKKKELRLQGLSTSFDVTLKDWIKEEVMMRKGMMLKELVGADLDVDDIVVQDVGQVRRALEGLDGDAWNDMKKYQVRMATESVNSLKQSLGNLIKCMNDLVKHHQSFIELMEKYRALSKNKLVVPYRAFVVMTHDAIGVSLNKLQDLISSVAGDVVLSRYSRV